MTPEQGIDNISHSYNNSDEASRNIFHLIPSSNFSSIVFNNVILRNLFRTKRFDDKPNSQHQEKEIFQSDETSYYSDVPILKIFQSVPNLFSAVEAESKKNRDNESFFGHWIYWMSSLLLVYLVLKLLEVKTDLCRFQKNNESKNTHLSFRLKGFGSIVVMNTTLHIECVLVNVLLLLTFPAIIGFHGSVFLARLFISAYLKYHPKWRHKNLRLLSGSDGLWALETTGNTSPFTSIYVVEGFCDIKKLKERIVNKLVNKTDPETGKKLYWKLKCRIKTMFGFPYWEPMCDHQFDVNHHVRLLKTDQSEWTEAQVFEAMAQQAHHMLDKTQHSPWEILVIPTFIYQTPKRCHENDEKQHYYALLIKVNHGIMDGVSAGIALNTAIADDCVKFSVNPMTKGPIIPLSLQILGIIEFLIYGPRKFFASLFTNEQHGLTGRKLSGPKAFSWTKPMCVTDLKKMKKEMKCSVNSIFMSCLMGAIEDYSSDKGIKLPRQVYFATTVALLPYQGYSAQNRFTMLHIKMDKLEGTGSTKLARWNNRLEKVDVNMKTLSTPYELKLHYLMGHLIGRCPVIVAQFFIDLIYATGIISNVPGPSESLHLLGSTIHEVAAWVPVKGKTGLGVAIFSYGSTARAAFVSDQCIIPKKKDLSSLVKHFENRFAQLKTISLKELNNSI